MNNLRWGIMAAVAALIISILLGITSGVNPVHILLRSLVFTIIFFGLGTGLRILVNVYFPEILYLSESSENSSQENPGSMINITVGNSGDYAVPEKYKDDKDAPELGNIESLISGSFVPVSDQGLDRKREEGYNSQGGGSAAEGFDPLGFQDSPPAGGAAPGASAFDMPVFTPSFGDDSGDLGGLPDLGSMALAFGSAARADSPADTDSSPLSSGGESFMASSPSLNETDFMSANKGNTPQPLEGDFDPKELAEGIRTVLTRDK